MSSKKHTLLLGAHVSIEGGFNKSIERGELIGCTVLQIFTKSNRQWHAKKITKRQEIAFKDALKKDVGFLKQDEGDLMKTLTNN